MAWGRHGPIEDARPALMVALGLLFTALAQPCIVFLNDLHDAEGDALHDAPTHFSGGSRVLVERRMSARTLRRGLHVCAGVFIMSSVLMAYLVQRPWVLMFAALTLTLSWLYSAPPVRGTSTRVGPWLQATGTGLVLPLLGGYLLTGRLDGLAWGGMVAMFLLGAANHILTTLPDRVADLRADKHTYATRHGAVASRRHLIQMVLAVAVMSPWVLAFQHPYASVFIIGACVGLSIPALTMLRRDNLEDRGPTYAFIILMGLSIQLIMIGWAAASLRG